MFDIKILMVVFVLPFAFACTTIAVQEAVTPPPEIIAATTQATGAADTDGPTCTGSTAPGRTMTCTSDLAYVCPDGWSACTQAGAATCCEKTFDVTDTGIDGLTTTS